MNIFTRSSLTGASAQSSNSSNSNNTGGGANNMLSSYASSFSLDAMKNNLTSVIDSTAESISNKLSTINKEPSESDKILTKRIEQQQIKENLSLYLSDIRLHCPQTSNGIAVVSSTHSMSPLISQHLKFSWYRLGSSSLYKSAASTNDDFYQVDVSSTPWYLPTIDDVGCNISVHCEDTIGEGLTHYVECGPIIADPLICTMSESAIENSFFEVKNVGVSLGVDEKSPEELLNRGINNSDTIFNVNGFDDKNAGGVDNSIPQSRPSSLSKKTHYLDLSGLCSISISSDTLFISICKSLNSGFGKGIKFTRHGGEDDIALMMSVYCTQPASVILTVPIRKKIASGSAAAASNASQKDMETWLTSSVLSIPWEYDGGSSPEATAAVGGNKHGDGLDEQARIEAAEKESLAFANTVVSLAEFVASLPESVEELKFCFSCGSRMDRDILAGTLRGIFCSKIGSTKTERLSVLPWRQVKEDEVKLMSLDVSSSANSSNISLDNKDMRVILRSLEEENVALKQEKAELTKEIMLHRELVALSSLKSNNSFARTQLQSNLQLLEQDLHATEANTHSKNDDNDNNNDNNNNNTLEISDNLKSNDVASSVSSDPVGDSSLKSVTKQDLQSEIAVGMKVIELENKLKISAKKESELQKSMKEIESRSQQLMVDIAKHKQDSDDAKITLTVVTHEKDSLLKRHNILVEKNADLEMKYKETVSQLKASDIELADLHLTFVKASEERDNLKSALQESQNELVDTKALLKSAQDTSTNLIAEQEKVTETYLQEIDVCKSKIASLESDLNESATLVAMQNESLQRLTNEVKEQQKIVAELMGIDQKCHVLQGENNHLRNKADTKDKEIKRLMAENAFVVGEFDKALSRKQQESNELQAQVYALNDQLFEIKSSSLNLIKSFQAISIPNFDIQSMFSNINLNSIKISKDSGESGENDVSEGTGDLGEGFLGVTYGNRLIDMASNIDISTPLGHMAGALHSLMESVLKESPISTKASDAELSSGDAGTGPGLSDDNSRLTPLDDESTNKNGKSNSIFSRKISFSSLASVLSSRASSPTNDVPPDASVTNDVSTSLSNSSSTNESSSLSGGESNSNANDSSSASTSGRLRTLSDSVQNVGTSLFRRLSLTTKYTNSIDSNNPVSSNTSTNAADNSSKSNTDDNESNNP